MLFSLNHLKLLLDRGSFKTLNKHHCNPAAAPGDPGAWRFRGSCRGREAPLPGARSQDPRECPRSGSGRRDQEVTCDPGFLL